VAGSVQHLGRELEIFKPIESSFEIPNQYPHFGDPPASAFDLIDFGWHVRISASGLEERQEGNIIVG